MKIGFSVKENKGTVLTGRKLSITLFSISENKGLKKVKKGLKTVAVSGETRIGRIKISEINVDEIDVDGTNIGGIDIRENNIGVF